jgi:hypothetical protein
MRGPQQGVILASSKTKKTVKNPSATRGDQWPNLFKTIKDTTFKQRGVKSFVINSLIAQMINFL